MGLCYSCFNSIKDSAAFCPDCGEKVDQIAPTHHLQPGTILAKRYMVGRSLGQGGFGITYSAFDTLLEMRVALKEYYPNGLANRTFEATVESNHTAQDDEAYRAGKDRFLREARTLAKFSREPGIVSIRDFFEENNTAYLVMEFLEGETLSAKLAREGILPVGVTLRILTPIMESLVKVHTAKLIHRDISPDNIMLSIDGAKLLDFGAARSATSEENKSLSVMLKAGYSPEEQYRKNGIQGPWTDVYAMCATIYKCITGVIPEEPISRLLNESLIPPSMRGIVIDGTVEKVIMKGLAIRSENRFQSMGEMMDALYRRIPV